MTISSSSSSASEANRATFEIKVALIGYVSVGKTTVLNALFRDKYGEVSMRRTTSGVNEFRISTRKSKWKVVVEGDSDSSTESISSTAPQSRTAKSTLEEIVADNVILRESTLVHKKAFDIELDDELCEMRDDTQLVIVDIPGINEAGASTKYKDYVSKNWHTFDCVIVVMDGRQGVNTEEQVELLNFVEKNSREKKEVRVIVLCNKVDDPDDEEQHALLAEVREAVERIFHVKDCEGTLKNLLDFPESLTSAKLSPVFLPLSAIHAFIYRTASLMDFEQFQKFDDDLIEKLGRENFGRKWKRLSAKEKKQKAFTVVSDPDQVRDGLETSNFLDFLKVLTYCVGDDGKQNQLTLIEKQIEVNLFLLNFNSCVATHLESIFRRLDALHRPTDHLKLTFWKLYAECEDDAFEKFKNTPANVDCMAAPMKQLVSYHSFVLGVGWDEEVEAASLRAKGLVRRQLEVVFEKSASSDAGKWKPDGDASDEEVLKWVSLSPVDWDTIFSSILLVGFDKQFCEIFGREKMRLEALSHSRKRKIGEMTKDNELNCTRCTQALDIQKACRACCIDYNYPNATSGENCPVCAVQEPDENFKLDTDGYCDDNCGKTFQKHPDDHSLEEALKTTYCKGTFVPQDPDFYKKVVHIAVPESLSDPKHFGHLLWTYCRFVESLEK